MIRAMNSAALQETIAAIATPPGEGGIAIIRISGPQSFAIADALLRCRGAKPGARSGGTFVFGRIVAGGEMLDDALCLIMKAPHSFTGEDTIELHCHGGTVPARRILRAVLQAGARSAEPGEFSRRAFLNGKMDLLQAEAVLDLIRAKSDRAAAAAVEQLEGSLSKRFNTLYDMVLEIASDLEASLDFPEDELPETVLSSVIARLVVAQETTARLLASWNEGHLLREGATVVIVGRPNAGKSTLLNALLGKDRAIVSHLPGTTRDVIEENIIINGIAVRLVDTAGLRNAECEIEREGVRRSRQQIERADLFLYVIDSSIEIHPDDREQISALDESRLILVLNKADLGSSIAGDLGEKAKKITISLLSGSGLDDLKTAMAEKLESAISANEAHAVISERHRALLAAANTNLGEAMKLAESRRDDFASLAAEHLKYALEQLGHATGRVYENELLDSIFSRFCIGK